MAIQNPHRTLSFRRWIRPLLAGLATGLLAFCLSGCRTSDFTRRPGADLATNRFEFTQPQMGVPFRIVVYAPDAPSAQRAAEKAFVRIAQLNDILSDYDTDSELSRLSRSSGQQTVVPVSKDLWVVLERAQQL